MNELLVLAIASAFWPILLVVVIISLRASHPILLLVSFLAGGLLTTMAVGLVVIYALQGSSLTGGSQSTFDPAVLIVAGALALLAAAVLWRRYGVLPEAPAEKPADADPGRLERMLDRGAPLAFAAGIVCNIIPGVFPLVALKDIAEMDIGFAETFVGAARLLPDHVRVHRGSARLVPRRARVDAAGDAALQRVARPQHAAGRDRRARRRRRCTSS